jgi:glucose/arabinose dehydrogenase
MGSRPRLPISSCGVYWGMRFPPLLLACALTACATSGSQRPSTSSTTSATPAPSSAAPASFVRTTAETPTIRNVEVRDGLTHQQAMRMLTDALAQRYVVDVVDPRAGFVMTTWQASVSRDGVPDLRYRTRFTARFVDDWRSLQLRSEARLARGDEADIGYDSALLDSLAADLRVKLGKKA